MLHCTILLFELQIRCGDRRDTRSLKQETFPSEYFVCVAKAIHIWATINPTSRFHEERRFVPGHNLPEVLFLIRLQHLQKMMRQGDPFSHLDCVESSGNRTLSFPVPRVKLGDILSSESSIVYISPCRIWMVSREAKR
jgi:hypothetical protein